VFGNKNKAAYAAPWRFSVMHIVKLEPAFKQALNVEMRHLLDTKDRVRQLKQAYAENYDLELVTHIQVAQSKFYEHYLLLKGIVTLYSLAHEYGSEAFTNYMMQINEKIAFEEVMEDMTPKSLQ
jgi:hypothetical protein